MPFRKTTYGQSSANLNYKTGVSLAADEVIASTPYVSIKHGGTLSIQCVIHGAALADAPSNTPVGVFELYTSADGVEYSLVSEAITTLPAIAPNGNNRVSAWANFSNTPGVRAKVRYKRTSGGATLANVTMNVITDAAIEPADLA